MTETSVPVPAATVANVPAVATMRSSAPAIAPSPPATDAQTATTKTESWTFDADKAEAAPAGFSFLRTGQGKEGRWRVVAAGDAPSQPNVLEQLDPDSTDYRFPLAVVEGSSFKNVDLVVSCKPVSGDVDQGCGLVWRLRDADNYYLTRANALEDNVRLYYVKSGRRIEFASWHGPVSSKQWHKLHVVARDNEFVVDFDDKKVLDTKDSTFSDAGRVGVWTKADSVIQFDDLIAKEL